MKPGILEIRWLNESFTASWMDRSGAASRWTATEPVQNAETLQAALSKARTSAGYLRRVRFLLDQRNLIFHVQETPPAPRKLLETILERLVAENRFFEEPATWIRMAMPSAPQRDRWLLAIMPRSLLEAIETACRENEIELIGIYPFASALASFLTCGEVALYETVLLVADSGVSHNLLVGRGDGQLLFARSIARSGASTDQRLEQEINRTLQFSQQRCGAEVTRILALGPECHATLVQRTLREGLKLDRLPDEMAGQKADGGNLPLSDDSPLNFVASRHWLPSLARPIVALSLAVLLLATMGFALSGYSQLRRASRAVDAAQQRQKALSQAKANGDERTRRAAELASLVEQIGKPGTTGRVATLTRYLSGRIPTPLRLTQLTVQNTTNGTQLELQGASRQQGIRFLTTLEDIEKILHDADSRIQITDSTRQRILAGTPDPAPSLLSPSSPRDIRGEERGFFVKGRIP